MERQDRVKGHRTWRSLDQPAAFFGIKGRFMTLFAIVAGAAAVIAITVGSSFGTMLGMVTFGALIFCDYMLINSLQGKMSDKEFSRLISKSGLTPFVKVTPDSIHSHLNRRITWK